ncbi:MAG TPA: hypothetical protein VG324_06785 [Blastocatellia bacterium]|nr:hypothetical protein [Blastocatellia bacterium]
MKINPDHSLRPLYLLFVIGGLQVIWVYFNWPWGIVIKTLFLLCAAYASANIYLIRRERERKEKLREEIRNLSDDLALKDDLTIEDLNLLYEVEELEQIISNLKGLPIGRRRLQTAVDAVEKQYG